MQRAEMFALPKLDASILMDQDTAQPLIPCVFCNHLNTPRHRFCGMCGKALPDPSRKAVKPAASVNPAPAAQPPLRGIGGGARLQPEVPARPIAPIPFDKLRAGVPVSEVHPEVHPEPHATASRPAATPPSAAVSSPPQSASRPRTSLHEDPNRDLSYLLEEDHAPSKPSRLPLIVGGVLLAAVAGFFAMRGGSKPTAPESVDGTTSGAVSEPVPESKAPATSTPPKQENAAPVAESPVSDSGSSQNSKEPAPEAGPEEAAPPSREAVPVAPAKVPAVPRARPVRPKVILKPAARQPAYSRKPSPSQPAATVPAAETAAPASVATSSDCDRVPALRKAADRGDVKARTSLGLVYYSGQCVPRDLPSAYHWYALALRANPDNPQLSAQLEAIWKQMSPAERQVAIRPQP